MVPVPTSYLNVPVFGSGAAVVQPDGSTYAGGFLPGQLFPAEYENWLMNRLTTNSLASQTTNLSVAAEIVNILSQASIAPDPASTTQLYAALNALYATVGALSSEASTRASADTTLQANINAEATARANADTTLQSNINAEAALARNANNLSSGTVPIARLSGITTSQLLASANIAASQIAANFRSKMIALGVVSSNTLLNGNLAGGMTFWSFKAGANFTLTGIGGQVYVVMSTSGSLTVVNIPSGTSSATIGSMVSGQYYTVIAFPDVD